MVYLCKLLILCVHLIQIRTKEKLASDSCLPSLLSSRSPSVQKQQPSSTSSHDLSGSSTLNKPQPVSHQAYRESRSKGDDDDSDDEKMVICEEEGMYKICFSFSRVIVCISVLSSLNLRITKHNYSHDLLFI